MPKKKGKSPSFDAMVKFFMQSYDIPTKKDIERLIIRMDRMENLLRSISTGGRRRTAGRSGSRGGDGKPPVTAANTVLDVIRLYPDGIGLVDIQEKTGYGDKKLRNVIYRLNRMGKIRRVSRGIYTAT
ncbi:MAG: hypothetical protein QNJ22_07350 [Desulfosarcinaceae bacterium]|nr:hypothetical protein [Desulfosarcinaceae bacterium]